MHGEDLRHPSLSLVVTVVVVVRWAEAEALARITEGDPELDAHLNRVGVPWLIVGNDWQKCHRVRARPARARTTTLAQTTREGDSGPMRRLSAALVAIAASTSILAGCTILDRLSKDPDPVVDEDAAVDGAVNEGGADSATADTSVGTDAAGVDAASNDAGTDSADGGTSGDAAGSDAASNDAQADGETG